MSTMSDATCGVATNTRMLLVEELWHKPSLVKSCIIIFNLLKMKEN
jgi:hypothetical protein